MITDAVNARGTHWSGSLSYHQRNWSTERLCPMAANKVTPANEASIVTHSVLGRVHRSQAMAAREIKRTGWNAAACPRLVLTVSQAPTPLPTTAPIAAGITGHGGRATASGYFRKPTKARTA